MVVISRTPSSNSTSTTRYGSASAKARRAGRWAPVQREIAPRPALALLAEAEILQGEEDRDGEGVVRLDHVDVFGAQPCHGKRVASRRDGRRLGQLRHLRDRHVVVRLAPAEHEDRWLGQVACAL